MSDDRIKPIPLEPGHYATIIEIMEEDNVSRIDAAMERLKLREFDIAHDLSIEVDMTSGWISSWKSRMGQ